MMRHHSLSLMLSLSQICRHHRLRHDRLASATAMHIVDRQGARLFVLFVVKIVGGKRYAFWGRQNFSWRVCNWSRHEKLARTRLRTPLGTQNAWQTGVGTQKILPSDSGRSLPPTYTVERQTKTYVTRYDRKHQLTNWSTKLTLQQKLCLPIFNTYEQPPWCKCGITHDQWGDHTFSCAKISKKFAHNIIRDSWANALQPVLSTSGYIRNNTTLDIERKHIKTRDITAQPFDISFDPEQTTTDFIHTPCPYTTIGADITITHSATTPSLNSSDDVIFSVTALADAHLRSLKKGNSIVSIKKI